MLLALLGVAFVSCGDSSSRFAAGTYENAVVLDQPSEQWLGQTSVEIGGVRDAGPYAFSRVGGLARGPDGILLIVDQYGHEVRVFSADGRFLYGFGRNGSGPGEFFQPCCLTWDGQGRLWVRDNGNVRYVVFRVSPSGAVFEQTFPSAGSSMDVAAGFTTEGVVDVSTRWGTLGPEYQQSHFSRDGKTVRKIKAPPVPVERIPHVTAERRSRTGIVGGVSFPLFGPRYSTAFGAMGVARDTLGVERVVVLEWLAAPATWLGRVR